MASPGFWDHPDAARGVIDQANQLKAWTEPWNALDRKLEDLTELAHLLADAEDEDLAAELDRETGSVEEGLSELELRNMLRGPDAHRSALLTVHPGAGGTESQDWAEMLLRMYSRYAERRGYTVQVLELQPGDEAGIKSATLEILGDHAFGYLGAETGVHRLVRISPYDAQGRRHTSFASVFVYPEVDDDVDVAEPVPEEVPGEVDTIFRDQSWSIVHGRSLKAAPKLDAVRPGSRSPASVSSPKRLCASARTSCLR